MHVSAGDARVLEGHSFIVGAAVSLGGRDMKAGINIYRFANRIPLLFEVNLQLYLKAHTGQTAMSCVKADVMSLHVVTGSAHWLTAFDSVFVNDVKFSCCPFLAEYSKDKTRFMSKAVKHAGRL